MYVLLLLLFIIPSGQAIRWSQHDYECPQYESVGVCIAGNCPDGTVCINGVCCIECDGPCLNNGCPTPGYICTIDNSCCLDNSTTLAPSTTTAMLTTQLPISTLAGCHDNSDQCAQWAASGFCTNAFLTPEYIKDHCAKTCNLC